MAVPLPVSLSGFEFVNGLSLELGQWTNEQFWLTGKFTAAFWHWLRARFDSDTTCLAISEDRGHWRSIRANSNRDTDQCQYNRRASLDWRCLTIFFGGQHTHTPPLPPPYRLALFICDQPWPTAPLAFIAGSRVNWNKYTRYPPDFPKIFDVFRL